MLRYQGIRLVGVGRKVSFSRTNRHVKFQAVRALSTVRRRSTTEIVDSSFKKEIECSVSDARRRFSSSPPPPPSSELVDDRGLLKFETLHELHRNSSEKFSSLPLFGTYHESDAGSDDGGGSFRWTTYGEFGTEVAKTREVLKQLGVRPYSKVGLISNNRWEWAAVACASYSLSATVVPMYEAQMAKDWLYILNDSECAALFCATRDVAARVRTEVAPHVPSLQGTVCFDGREGEEDAFSTLMGRAGPSDGDDGVVAPASSDLANLIYTSGTTGVPKGVELMHSNSVSNLMGVRDLVEHPDELVTSGDRSLSFLPWAHSYGQTCELWWLMAHGASMGVCRGVPSILEDLQMVKPTCLFSVPTLYKRVYDGVMNLMNNAPPLRRKLMKRALELGRLRSSDRLGLLDKAQLNLFYDKVVLQKIRDRFGGRLAKGFCAGAACPKEIVEFMDDVGIPISEGYGLTETSPVISINAFSEGTRTVGSVGLPIPGVNVCVVGPDGEVLGPDEEGEICCYGPNVMKGYYRKPAETSEVMSLAPDGVSRMFHTGDLGKLSPDNFLYITGRLKELYKLENGKYICPTPIEEAVGMSRFVLQVVLCGANRPFNTVLLVPDWAAIRAELQDEESDEETLVNDDHVAKLINHELQITTSHMKKFERPKKWALVAPFTSANNMLTPKMSVRRHVVIKTYDDLICGMYESNEGHDCEERGAEQSKEVAA